MQAYRAGMEIGDPEYGFFAAINYQIHSFFLGIPLQPILEESSHFVNRLEQFGNESVASFALSLHHMWMCLARRNNPHTWLDSLEGRLCLHFRGQQDQPG